MCYCSANFKNNNFITTPATTTIIIISFPSHHQAIKLNTVHVFLWFVMEWNVQSFKNKMPSQKWHSKERMCNFGYKGQFYWIEKFIFHCLIGDSVRYIVSNPNW